MDECKCWLESYKNSLTLRRQQSGEEKRQKGLHFSLVLLNSKKPAIKTLCIKYKEGKRDTKTRGSGCAKRKGIPEPLSAAQASERASGVETLAGRLQLPCESLPTQPTPDASSGKTLAAHCSPASSSLQWQMQSGCGSLCSVALTTALTRWCWAWFWQAAFSQCLPLSLTATTLHLPLLLLSDYCSISSIVHWAPSVFCSPPLPLPPFWLNQAGEEIWIHK